MSRTKLQSERRRELEALSLAQLVNEFAGDDARAFFIESILEEEREDGELEDDETEGEQS